MDGTATHNDRAPLRPADNFRDAYRAFQEELSDRDLLEAYYVERADNPVEKLKTRLKLSESGCHMLYAGQARSGKTTVLHCLAEGARDEYYVVFLSVFKDFQPADVKTIDLLLRTAAHLCRQALQDDVPISADLQQVLNDWLLQNSSETFQTKVSKKTKDFSIGAKLKYLVGELGGTYSLDSELRVESRRKLEPRVAEIAENIKLLAEQIRQSLGREPLVIIDDLEKTSIETQEDLFFRNAPTLISPDCRIIYTINRALYYRPEWRAIRATFRHWIEIPYIRTTTRKGDEYAPGLALLRDLLLKRIEPKLITPDALERLIKSSNGVLGDLMAVAADCCLDAFGQNAERITYQMVDRSAQAVTNGFQRLLGSADYAVARRIHETKRANPDDQLTRLMFSQAVLEYEDEVGIYYDVHPAIVPLLKVG